MSPRISALRRAIVGIGLLVACAAPITPAPRASSAVPSSPPAASPTAAGIPGCRPTIDDAAVRMCASFMNAGSNASAGPWHADYNLFGEWGNPRRFSAIVSGAEGDPAASRTGGAFRTVSVSFASGATGPRLGQTYSVITGGYAEGTFGGSVSRSRNWVTERGTVTIVAVDGALVTFEATLESLRPTGDPGNDATGTFSLSVVGTVRMNAFPGLVR